MQSCSLQALTSLSFHTSRLQTHCNTEKEPRLVLGPNVQKPPVVTNPGGDGQPPHSGRLPRVSTTVRPSCLDNLCEEGKGGRRELGGGHQRVRLEVRQGASLGMEWLERSSSWESGGCWELFEAWSFTREKTDVTRKIRTRRRGPSFVPFCLS
uniref:Uncharacterized protein n=1 Tax=Cannabis sativa TaxID=3483 RepID=A0A803P619_CANSA